MRSDDCWGVSKIFFRECVSYLLVCHKLAPRLSSLTQQIFITSQYLTVSQDLAGCLPSGSLTGYLKVSSGAAVSSDPPGGASASKLKAAVVGKIQ